MKLRNSVEVNAVQFFLRNGMPVLESNLSKVAIGVRGDSGHLTLHENCPRCGGQGGSTYWRPDGGVCYQCHGARTIPRTYRVFTAEKLAKLVAAADKREEKKADAAVCKAKLERLKFIAWARPRGKLIGGILMATGTNFLTELGRRLHRHIILTDRQMDAAKKTLKDVAERKVMDDASGHVSEIGKRIEFDAHVVGVYGTEGFYGHVDIVKFRDLAGNLFTWFASRYTALEREDRILIKGTVKKHDEYRGVKQTILSRCKFTKFEVLTADEAAAKGAVA